MKNFLQRLLRYWKWFAKKLAFVQTLVILALIYFLVVSIMSAVARVLRRDLLGKRLKNVVSFWTKKETEISDLESFRHQF